MTPHLIPLRELAFGAIARHSDQPLPGLSLLRLTEPTALYATLYEPMICLILQGRKDVVIGDAALGFGVGEALLVSHDLPVVSKVVEASREAPYLALVLHIDLSLLRGLYEQLADVLDTGRDASFVVGAAPPELVEALLRYLRLAGDPVRCRVLGPGVLRELHFHLLMSPVGGMLRELLRHDSHASQVARAIGVLRRDFRQPIAGADLARVAGMSASSFHKHFKAITATTPLQYQKDLRLLEARRLLQAEGFGVSDAAYEVGYESPTQFSREYRRKFGNAPSRERATAL